MVSPRPVPPAAAPAFVCANASKISVSASGSMPGPVSSTSNRRRSPSPRAMATSTRPAAANLIALPSRLSITCRRCLSSRTAHRGASSPSVIVNRSPFRSAVSPTTYSRSVRTRTRSVGASTMSRRPASIFERSSTSLIRSSSCDPHLAMASTARRCAGARRCHAAAPGGTDAPLPRAGGAPRRPTRRGTAQAIRSAGAVRAAVAGPPRIGPAGPGIRTLGRLPADPPARHGARAGRWPPRPPGPAPPKRSRASGDRPDGHRTAAPEDNG